MERQTPSSVNPSGRANSSSPHPRPIHESTAASGFRETVTSIPSGTPQAGSPPVADAPAPHQKPEAADRIETTAPSHQPLIPVLQPPAARSTPERTANLAVRPTTGSTLRERPSSPTRPPMPHLTMARPMSTGHPGSSTEKLEDADSLLAMGYPELHRYSAVRTDQSLPPLPHARLVDNGSMPTRRQRSYDPGSLGHGPGSRKSNTDWLADEKRKPTVADRLEPTLEVASAKRDTYAAKAKSTGWMLNTAIGLQVLFGSITTGLSAVGTSGRSTAVQTTIFGALSTLVASYLAKARGSKEPELSIVRTRDLEHFIREIKAFMLDHGHVDTEVCDKDINRFRRQLEEILSNANDKGLKSASTA